MTKPFATVFSSGIALLAAITTVACSPSQSETRQSPSQQISSGPWEVVGQLPLPLESHQTVVLNDVVYLLGGWNDERGPYAEVFFTPMTPDGTLESWQEASAPLPSRLQHHAVMTHNNALYVLGGDNGFWDGSTVSDKILRAIFTPDGDITDWVEVGQLPVPLTIHAVTLIDDQLYVIGGSQTFRPGTTVEDAVFTASILDNGEVSEFETLTTFPTPIGWLTAVAVDQRIFGLSGKTQFSPRQLVETVWVAEIQADQSLSPFEAVSAIVPRQRHTTVLVDDTLVAIAGGGEEQVLTSVQAADIDEQGNLTPWRDLSPLPEPRYAHAAFTHEGDIYVSGGFVRYGSNETSRDIFRLSAEKR